MQNYAFLFTLSIIFFFTAVTGLSAQYQEKRLTVPEEANYDAFSAIYDEAGFKADVYRGNSTTTAGEDPERYTQQAEEINVVKALFAAYNQSDWNTMLTFYAPDAAITHNISGQLTPDQLVAGMKNTRGKCTTAKVVLTDEEIERVITDKGETWVNLWGDFEATIPGLEEALTIPVHFTYHFEDKKIIEEHAYYDFGVFSDAVESTQQRIHFIEVWTATEAWTVLNDQEQAAYLEALAAPIESLLASGAEIISWGINHEQTDQRADYDFFAIWSFPNQESVKSFEQAVASSGWYRYFRQANMSGLASSPATVMEYLIKQ